MSLSQLYTSDSAPPRPGRGKVSAWWLPVVLVIGFGGLFAFVFRDRLLPAIEVHVERAILLADFGGGESGGAQVAQVADAAVEAGAGAEFSGAMLFQAAGWFEPDPLPIRATALTDGVISQVHVLEGQEVAKGELLAELIAEDAELALRAASRAKEAVTAEHHMHLAQIPAADAEAAGILGQRRAAEARLEELKDVMDRLEKLSKGTVSAGELVRARLAVKVQEAEIEALGSQHLGALAKLEAIESQSVVFESKIAEAVVVEEERKLALERTKIVSPVDGVVLELKAAPGQKKMLGMDDADSATVAVLFEKGKLQARVDVPLADARGLMPGQAALVTTDFLPNVEFRGVVTRIVGSADLQRNTLQAKVRVIDPDGRLRPEMLCRVKFLEKVNQGGGEVLKSGGSVREESDGGRVVMVPERALVGNVAWVIGADEKSAERREVVLGRVKRDEYISVETGVLAGEEVILPPHEGLTVGRRVRKL